MISLKYNSLNYAKYLNNCDLNYKYYIKSIKDTPNLDKIIFELPTNKLPNIEITEDDYQNRLLLKCFLSVYFINSKFPYINCNKIKNENITLGSNNNYHYAYLQTSNTFVNKYQLMLLLLNENDRSNINIKNLTNFNNKLNSNKKNILNFRLEAQASKIVEFKDIFNIFFNRTELQSLKIKINFLFKNFNTKMISINEFRNFFFIWNI